MSERGGEPRRLAVIDRAACVGCEQCAAVCPTDAITMQEGIAVIAAERCTGCGECVPVCPTEAVSMTGREAEAAPAGEEEAVAAADTGEAAAPEVWVFVEHSEGRPATVSWELLGKGKELSRDLGGRLCAVLLGEGVQGLTAECFAYGAERVYLMEDPVLAHYRTQPYVEGLVRMCQQHRPAALILGATTLGRDLAGAVATRLRTGLTADCTGLSIDPQSKLLEQTRPAYGGNIMATILCEQRRPQMATVRPRVMSLPAREETRTGEVVRQDLGMSEEGVLTRVLEYAHVGDGEEVRIEDAEILVSGGRGCGGPDGFRLLQELAEVMGGAVSGSRATVDQGWIEHARQVGQTGKTVRPKLYVACGISGAIQHLVGMQTADFIVAINRDPNAPIFGVADIGIVGDVAEVVPALTRACKARLAAGEG